MAKVLNLSLTVGKSSDGTNFAQVKYDIEFNSTEISLDLGFTEIVGLYERDRTLDIYVPKLGADLSPHRIPADSSDTRDGYIGEIAKEEVRPDGNTLMARLHRREWVFPANEKGKEEYRALVWLLPEIRGYSEWSNEVLLNLT